MSLTLHWLIPYFQSDCESVSDQDFKKHHFSDQDFMKHQRFEFSRTFIWIFLVLVTCEQHLLVAMVTRQFTQQFFSFQLN
mgnify:CR=1 FL=1